MTIGSSVKLMPCMVESLRQMSIWLYHWSLRIPVDMHSLGSVNLNATFLNILDRLIMNVLVNFFKNFKTVDKNILYNIITLAKAHCYATGYSLEGFCRFPVYDVTLLFARGILSLPTILHVLADVISFCLRSAQDRIERPQETEDWHRWAFPSGAYNIDCMLYIDCWPPKVWVITIGELRVRIS